MIVLSDFIAISFLWGKQQLYLDRGVIREGVIRGDMLRINEKEKRVYC